MSFCKAEQLLALAMLVAARHSCVTLGEIIDRFAISKRTAQRMLRALEAQFPDTRVGAFSSAPTTPRLLPFKD